MNATVSGSLDRLSAVLERAESMLKSIGPCRTTFVTLFEQDNYREVLGFLKWHNEWRICYGHFDALDEIEPSEWKPVRDCSAVERVDAVKWIPVLKQAIEKAVVKFEKEIDGSAAELEQFLAELDSTSNTKGE